MKIKWKSNENGMEMHGKGMEIEGNRMEIEWKLNGNGMEMHGNGMEIEWELE